MSKPDYISILKGKENDLKAYGALSSEIRAKVKPLIELMPTPSEGTVNGHLAKFLSCFEKYAGTDKFFVDFYGFMPGETTAGGTLAVVAGYERLYRADRLVTPVYGLGRDESVWEYLPEIVERHGQGFCFRLELDDLEEDVAEATWQSILTRSEQLNLRPGLVDLVLDLRDVRLASADEKIELIVDFFAYMPDGLRFRTLAVAGSSAPKDVTCVRMDSIGSIFRNELKIWAHLRVDLPFGGQLVYGDYGIVHPDFAADDLPVGGTMNAKIRYTCGNSIMIFRGHKRAGDSGQYHELARSVRAHERYCGDEFSVGDEFISDVADRDERPGNPGNWVFADMNHHLTFVALQMSHLAGALTSDLSNDEAAELLDTTVDELL